MYKIDIHPCIWEEMDRYTAELMARFRNGDKEWWVPEETSEKNITAIMTRMEENFKTKIELLQEKVPGRIFSLPWMRERQILIPSEGIYLLLTYEEDIETLTRYITDIEILRK